MWHSKSPNTANTVLLLILAIRLRSNASTILKKTKAGGWTLHNFIAYYKAINQDSVIRVKEETKISINGIQIPEIDSHYKLN